MSYVVCFVARTGVAIQRLDLIYVAGTSNFLQLVAATHVYDVLSLYNMVGEKLYENSPHSFWCNCAEVSTYGVINFSKYDITICFSVSTFVYWVFMVSS